MKISQLILAQLWLYAFFLGAGLGAVYDTLRITRVFLGISFDNKIFHRLRSRDLPFLQKRKERKPIPFSKVLVFSEDFLFVIFSAIAAILLFYQLNNGRIRVPAILCILVGLWLYYATVGKLWRTICCILVFFIETAFRYLFFFLLFPFKSAYKALQKLFLRLREKNLRKTEKKKRLNFTKKEILRAKRDACGMIFSSMDR